MIKHINLAIQFLTRIPWVKNYSNVTDKDLANSIIYYPLVGILYGLSLYAVAYITPKSLPLITVGIILITVEFIISGGLHYDGLSDVSDAWFSSRSIERQLEIMKDSNTGVMGVVSLIIMLLFKITLIAELSSSFTILIIYGFIGKLMVVYAIVAFPYARKKGTGGLFTNASYKQLIWSIIYLPVIVLLVYKELSLLLAMAITVILSIMVANILNKRYKGLTGDCYGALNEITQVIFLITIGVLK